MRLRSGRIVQTCAPAAGPTKRTRAKRKSTRRKSNAPLTVGTLVRAVADRSQEKKRHTSGRAGATPASTFGSYLIGSEIAPGTGSFQRIGDVITTTRISVKYQLTASAVAGAAPQNGVSYLYMYILRTTRDQNPSVYWYQQPNSDENDAFGTAPLTAAGDVTRMNRKLNKREIKVLAFKRHTLSPRTTTDEVACNHIQGQFSTKKLRMKFHYNTLPAAATPYSNTQVRPNVYFVWFILQPDENGARTSPLFNAEVDQYYQE